MGKVSKAWIKFRISNQSQDFLTAYLGFCSDFDSIQVYAGDENQLAFASNSGSRLHSRDKQLPFFTNSFNFSIRDRDSMEVYILATLNPAVGSEHFFHIHFYPEIYPLIHGEFNRTIRRSIFFGIMFLLACFGIVMVLSFKERVFIYYSLFVIAWILYFVNVVQLFSYFFDFNIKYIYVLSSNAAIPYLVIFSYLFSSRYLNLKVRMPVYNRIYLIVALVVTVYSFSYFFIMPDLRLGTRISNILLLVYMPFIMIPIFYLFKRSKSARVSLVSTLVLFVGASTYTLALLGILPQYALFWDAFQLGAIGFSGILFYGLFDKINQIQKDKLLLSVEKEKTDELLFNILPSEVATELKENGFCEARDYSKVNVMFTDFKDFTATSNQLSAKELVYEVNSCFVAFDQIIEKYKIEKIKTIGDSYMAASGLETQTETRVVDIVLAAIEMQDFLSKRNREKRINNQHPFEMRVGIHTGPVVAGIVGVKKFQYDIWGDTVNTASRIESYGQVGKVNISDATYQFIKDEPDFVFEKREELEVKGKGKISMWFVSRKHEI